MTNTGSVAGTGTGKPCPVSSGGRAETPTGQELVVQDSEPSAEDHEMLDVDVEHQPHRLGALWSYEDHEDLIWALRQGFDDVETAAHLQRSMKGIHARAKLMVDPRLLVFEAQPKQRPLQVLRQLTAQNPRYNWRYWVHRYPGTARVWSPPEIDRLRRAWEQADPLTELVGEFEATELQVVHQLMALRVAESTMDVVARLGCRPGGVVDHRARLAADRAACSVWVLVALCDDVSAPDVSIHLSREAAEQARDALQQPGLPAVTSWWIAQRAPGDIFTRVLSLSSSAVTTQPD